MTRLLGKFPYLIQELTNPFGENISLLLSLTINMILYTGAVYVLISWSGAQYVRAEIPRIGNENILNGLKEAVFVVDEDSRYILF